MEMETLHIVNGRPMRRRHTSLESSVGSPVSLKNRQNADPKLPDQWDRQATPMMRNEYGVWEVTLHAKDGQPVIPHNTKVKVLDTSIDPW